MKVTGKYTLKASPQQVWDTVTDPEKIKGCLPGCNRMERTNDNEYTATLSVGVGAVKGTYEAKITMVDLVPHSSYKMLVEGNGSAGFVRGEGDVKLDAQDNGGTVIYVEGDAQVGGTVALVGQRLMSTVSKQMMDRFFRCVGRSIS